MLLVEVVGGGGVLKYLTDKIIFFLSNRREIGVIRVRCRLQMLCNFEYGGMISVNIVMEFRARGISQGIIPALV
jgi:hypothetical protein